MSIKRDRCVNWDADEKILLRAIIRPYLKIIVNKNLSTKTNKEKQKAWGEIMDKFNQANVRARDKKQLLNQWKLMKMESKKPVSHNRKQLLSTVGDPKPPTPSPDHWDTVMVPQEFYVDNNKYDDDSEPATATYTNSDDCKMKPEFEFKKETFEDMKHNRQLVSDRLQKEHEMRLQIMKEQHDQIMKNLKLQEELIKYYMNK